jgi:glycosyltransferase involved in cell wall biosynthesis
MIAKSLGDHGSNLSIMIPTFNCADYLRETLTSLLQQPSGSLELAQIVIVDDCSTRDDPETVVQEMAAGRAQFHRHSHNRGVCGNLNSCLDMAEREWIQILHGDDYMLPGAYEEFCACLEQFPDALAVFARSQIVSSGGNLVCESDPLGPDERGRLTYDPAMWRRNPIYPGGVLLNRRVIDIVGKFDCTFSHVNVGITGGD